MDENSLKTSNKFKKIAFALLIIVLFEGWIIYKLNNTLNNIEDKIILPSFYFSELDPKYTDDFFSAKGSWISDTKLAYPAQTTEITCYKNWGYCIENNAQLGIGNVLSVDSTLQPIDLWTKDLITTKPSESAFGCVEYTSRIDRINKRVTSIRTTKNNKEGLCEGIQDAPIVSYLDDGQERLNKIKSQK